MCYTTGRNPERTKGRIMYKPVFARYLHRGMSIPHPTIDGYGVIQQINYTPPTATPGRPWGTVGGMMSCPKSECGTESEHSHGFTYPADALILVRS